MFKTKRTRPDTTSTNGDLSTPVLKTYTSLECAQVARVSLRQLQWWDERKVVSHAARKAHRRVYSAEEVIEITVIAELRRKGFSLQKIRRVLRFLHREMGKKLAEVLDANSELHLVTDGKSIFLEDQHSRIIDLMKDARQPMFLVCVSDQVVRLREPRGAQAGADRVVSGVIDAADVQEPE